MRQASVVARGDDTSEMHTITMAHHHDMYHHVTRLVEHMHTPTQRRRRIDFFSRPDALRRLLFARHMLRRHDDQTALHRAYQGAVDTHVAHVVTSGDVHTRSHELPGV